MARYVTLVSRLAFAGCLLVAFGCGSGGGNDHPPSATPPVTYAAPQFRAIAGVSMGAYGAMNLGTSHSELFGTIGALGGPVDLQQLLHDIIAENLDVKAQTALPQTIGDPTTYDHMLPYPGRDKRLSMIKDLVLAFGNPVLHHPDLTRQYLASDSEPAQLREDDVLGSFSTTLNPRGFFDGGDPNADGSRSVGEIPTEPADVLLMAGGSLPLVAGDASPVSIGGRELADLDGDGTYDVGEGLVVNAAEPFTDANHNLIFEPQLGETFEDSGLDGVPGTGDFGEGNGSFDYDPDRAHWLERDPLTRLAARSASAIAAQRIYMDVGTEDEFGFARHYDNFVAMLRAKGLAVTDQQGFPANCLAIPKLPQPFLLYRYVGGHIGIPEADSIADDLLHGDYCGAVPIWRRLLTLIAYVNSSFPDGVLGPGNLGIGPISPIGDTIEADLPAPALVPSPGAAVPVQHVLVYRPPAFAHSARPLPILYLLGGYGQKPQDFAQLGTLMDVLILGRFVQNMFIAVLPGAGGHKGSFYVNHQIPEEQDPDIASPTSGRYGDAIIQDLLPDIEHSLLHDRVRRQ